MNVVRKGQVLEHHTVGVFTERVLFFNQTRGVAA